MPEMLIALASGALLGVGAGAYAGYRLAVYKLKLDRARRSWRRKP